MTSNDAPAPGPAAGRRRALGRGPGTARPEPSEATSPPTAAPAAPQAAAEPEPVALLEAAEPEPEAVEPQVVAEPDPVAPLDAAEPEFVAPQAAAEPEPGVVASLTVVEPGPGPESEAVASPAVVGPEPGALPSGAVAPGRGTDTAVVPEPVAGARSESSGGSGPGEPLAEDAAPSDGIFKVRLSNFEGPFDLLLQLISKHKLDVTEVALSKVTDEFMAHIRAMGPDWDLDQTTEFLVVAATLLDLKAARLLPTAEVEDEADLALLEARDLLFARLLQYRAYKQIADIFNQRLDEEARRYPRTVGLEPQHAELLPEVVISIGPEGFAKLAVKAMQPKAKPQVYVDHIHAPLVSVQEQAGIVVARLRELGEASFRALVEDTDDTLTVVARFLALLELYREKAVALEQETALGDLLVRWTGGDGDAAPMVTDEFDRPPEEPKEEKKA
ncbi:segregation/condensation protein A [Streptomyces sp. NPDC101165]|uniref:segregation/condensation protein A n=1 Tax=Streptomyces sp. NPDC101165 TaxID=3366119 RepID=UPI00382679D8